MSDADKPRFSLEAEREIHLLRAEADRWRRRAENAFARVRELELILAGCLSTEEINFLVRAEKAKAIDGGVA